MSSFLDENDAKMSNEDKIKITDLFIDLHKDLCECGIYFPGMLKLIVGCAENTVEVMENFVAEDCWNEKLNEVQVLECKALKHEVASEEKNSA
jgi:hypothetical protein